MHMHKLEKIWLSFGFGSLILFLVIVGIHAFAGGNHLATSDKTLDPTKAATTAPFDNPGLKKIGENEFELVVLVGDFTFAMGKNPDGSNVSEIEIPEGATVHIKVTSKDVVHGFEVAGTNANMMVVPGHVNELTTTFTKKGVFTLVCNEYCGMGHAMMFGKVKVV